MADLKKNWNDKLILNNRKLLVTNEYFMFTLWKRGILYFCQIKIMCILKKLNSFENREYCSESANQGLSDSLTHWLRDSGFFLNNFKIPFCLDVLIVPFVITFFFSGFFIIKKNQKDIFIYLSFNWNFTKFLKLLNVTDSLRCNTWNVYIHR